MIDEHQKLRVQGKTGKDIEIEVNYSDSEKVKGCKVLKMKIGQEESVISSDDLVSIMMIIGNSKQQRKLLPTQVTKVRKMERLLTFQFKAKRKYEVGEVIRIQAPWIDTIPEAEEVLAGALKGKSVQQPAKSNIYLGK